MPLTSRFAMSAVPDVSVTRFLRDRIAAHGDAVALVDGPSGRSYTFRQLLDLSSAVAGALAARGIRKGDRVAFVCPNLPEVALAWHGVIAAGGVAMMLNPLSTPEELEHYFALGTPSMVVTVAMFLDPVRTAAPALPVVVIGEASGDGVEPLSALLRGPALAAEVDIDPAEDLAVMPFSSGTTGFPKGVMLTHRNLVAQVLSLQAVEDAPILLPGSNVIAVLPFFHIYGIVAFLTYGTLVGATIVTLPRFDLELYLGLARRHRVPILHLVPPILLAIAKYHGELDLPDLTGALSGAAPLSAELAAEFTARTGAMVSQVYGMTEVTGASHLGSRDPARNHPGSIGEAIPGIEVKVVADDGSEVATGQPGEVWVRGPIVMKGYFGDARATADNIDPAGWLHTGDIGYADERGQFFIVDRIKELIKYKALQVAPAELEAVLLRHPAVADAAVYPAPDDEAGEIPKAAVVLRPGHAATAEELMHFVGEHVAPQKKVRAVRFVGTIPKSASGKILRRVLVAEERTARHAAQAGAGA